MPFIGQQPTTGTFVELDSLTASATADYTLQLNGANYEPESVNNLLVSINGVIQGSNTMSLSGSTLTVGATLSSSDVIDFVRVFGNVGTISTPTDGSVTANKIGTGAVTSAKIADGTIVNADINASAGIAGSKLGTGAVLQVKQTINNTPYPSAFNSTTFTDITGMSVSITPISTSSNILISTSLSWGCAGNPYGAVIIQRDGSNLDVGQQTGTSHTQATFALQGVDNEYRLMCTTFQLLDTSVSTTSPVTYKLQWRTNVNLWLNRVNNLQTATNANVTSGVSTITVMEIGG